MEKDFLHILKGKATKKERSQFFESLAHNSNLKSEFMAFQKIWVLNNMKYRSRDKKKIKKSFNRFWSDINTSYSLYRRIWPTLSTAVALLAICLIVSNLLFKDLFFTSVETFTISSPKGNISSVELSDGSKLWFNSGAKASVTVYNHDKITVELNGEAFFDIPHDKNREFIIEMGEYSVYDLGTQFNLKYDKDNQLINLSLFEGEVAFKKGENNLYSDLLPGEALNYNIKNAHKTVYQCDKDYITAWKHGKFVFIDQPLIEIAKELEEWYDVTIEFGNGELKDDLFSGVIKRRTSMEHILKVLQLTSNLNYAIDYQKDGSCYVIFE
ncbi:DUF4974 domain-containing protein [Marinilabiliaceae bacterium ANBcel2]|nr:DUF4974 domain-containing protein [Marinilabiliaceae bacterium ANBcel2]